MDDLRGSMLGASVKRREDPRLVRGEGTYLSNRRVEGAAWMVPVRSQVAHGVLRSIETGEAAAMPGVVGVFTAADFPQLLGTEFSTQPEATRTPLITGDRVRFVGDVVAVVVAETEREAVEAAAVVWPEIDPLPPLPDVAAALLAGAPLLFEGHDSNVVDQGTAGSTASPVAGTRTLRLRVVHQRVAPVPLETNNAIAIPDGERVEIWLGTQAVHGARNAISTALEIDRNLFRVRVPDMGGGFGAKIMTYREQVLTVALARRLGRPVRWQESRTESMLGLAHGRAQIHDVEADFTDDGVVHALRFDVVQDVGAYPQFAARLPSITGRMASGPYAIPSIDYRWKSVMTTTTPTNAYRGAGRPEAAVTLERVMDRVAAETGLDPAEVRRRNLQTADAFPWVTATGERYDSGDYAAALDLALTTAGYDELRDLRDARIAAGDPRRLGIGVSTYVEVTAPGGRKDWGAVEVHPDGSATVSSGASSHGQGHETTFAQLVADRLRIPIERISFVQGDTDRVARGGGTMGSRSLQMAGSAVVRAGDKVLEQARQVLADELEANPADITLFDDGRLGVVGDPAGARTWAEVATLALERSPDRQGLAADEVYVQAEATVPFGAHVAVVEVDVETGDVTLIRHVACDDAGVIVNRMVLDGQVHGGVAQGAGQALFEEFVYDSDANPLTTNLTGYPIPTATTLPSFDVAHTCTPSPENELGVKGIGEAGTIGATPAIHGAVLDALTPLGVTHLDMPLTPSKVWTAIRSTDHG